MAVLHPADPGGRGLHAGHVDQRCLRLRDRPRHPAGLLGGGADRLRAHRPAGWRRAGAGGRPGRRVRQALPRRTLRSRQRRRRGHPAFPRAQRARRSRRADRRLPGRGAAPAGHHPDRGDADGGVATHGTRSRSDGAGTHVGAHGPGPGTGHAAGDAATPGRHGGLPRRRLGAQRSRGLRRREPVHAAAARHPEAAQRHAAGKRTPAGGPARRARRARASPAAGDHRTDGGHGVPPGVASPRRHRHVRPPAGARQRTRARRARTRPASWPAWTRPIASSRSCCASDRTAP